jgi:tRNA 2-thiouridine synthesizing protein A
VNPTAPELAPSGPPIVREVDATDVACPMPIIELARAIGEIEVGQAVRLLATDPAARIDVPVWCRMQRHRLHTMDEAADGTWQFVVERIH